MPTQMPPGTMCVILHLCVSLCLKCSEKSGLHLQLRKVAPLSTLAQVQDFVCFLTNHFDYTASGSVSMVTPCPFSVHTLKPPISVMCKLELIANSVLFAGRQTFSNSYKHI